LKYLVLGQHMALLAPHHWWWRAAAWPNHGFLTSAPDRVSPRPSRVFLLATAPPSLGCLCSFPGLPCSSPRVAHLRSTHASRQPRPARLGQWWRFWRHGHMHPHPLYPLQKSKPVSAFFPPLCKDEQKRYHNGF
jgi:hypothetical protein